MKAICSFGLSNYKKAWIYSNYSTVISARYINTKYFSRHPLNYETFQSRIEKFNSMNAKNSGMQSNVNSYMLVDLIKAGKELQKGRTAKGKAFKPENVNLFDELGLRTQYSNSEIDMLLFQTLHNYRDVGFTDKNVTREYLMGEPRPKNPNNILIIAEFVFKWNLGKRRIDLDIIQLALNILLKNKDYMNALQLIDRTCNAPVFLEYQKGELVKSSGSIIMAYIAGAIIACHMLPMIPSSILASVAFLSTLSTMYAYLKMLTLRQVGRLTWRSQSDLSYKFQHKYEMLFVNKIITNLEERNEVHIRNFHHIEARIKRDLNLVESDDYIIDFSEGSFNAAIEEIENPEYEDPEVLRLQVYFKQELRKRRLQVTDLQEELMFLEFWNNMGEDFIWIEPEQDPAEIVEFRLHDHEPKTDLLQLDSNIKTTSHDISRH